MNRLVPLEPTPEALRSGRLTMAVVAVIGIVLSVLILFDPGFGDAQTLAILGALGLTLVGDSIAYLGRPTRRRYRTGLAITTIGIVAGFWFLLATPFARPG